MKKLPAIFIALLYLAFTSGLLVEVHHCMGKIAGISVATSQSDTCDKCGMAKGDNNCCKDELKQVKLQDDHHLTYSDFQVAVPEISIQYANLINDPGYHDTLTRLLPGIHAPPGYPGVSLDILHCVFRI